MRRAGETRGGCRKPGLSRGPSAGPSACLQSVARVFAQPLLGSCWKALFHKNLIAPPDQDTNQTAAKAAFIFLVELGAHFLKLFGRMAQDGLGPGCQGILGPEDSVWGGAVGRHLIRGKGRAHGDPSGTGPSLEQVASRRASRGASLCVSSLQARTTSCAPWSLRCWHSEGTG